MRGVEKLTSDHELTVAILKLWPNFIAYVLSFSVIGIMWQNHHALFRTVDTIDRRTVFLNLLLLAATVLIPFATSLLGIYPAMHGSTFLYGAVLTLCSTWYNVLLGHLVKSGAFQESVTQERIATTVRAYRIGWLTYAFAMLVALVLPLASFALYVLIAVYYLVPRGIDADITKYDRQSG